MNEWQEIIIPSAIVLGYLGSLQWQIRGKVGKDRFEDLKGYIKERFDLLDKKIDKINNKEDKDV